MTQRSSFFRSVIMSLFGIYLFIYPFAVFLVAFNRVPDWGTSMGGVLLMLQGSMMGLWLTLMYGRHGMIGAGLIVCISWAIEHLGETTGFPFGLYAYTEVLVPKINGGVPLAIPFAWLLVVPAAMGVTDRMHIYGRALSPLTQDMSVATGQDGRRRGFVRSLITVMVAASFATLLDVTIEPVAVHVNNYWIWDHTGGYYDVPLSNFAAWWMTSALLVGIILWLRRAALANQSDRLNISPWLQHLPLRMYLFNLVMFMLINLVQGQIAAAIIGGLILGYLVFEWQEPSVVRWVMNGITRTEPQNRARETIDAFSGIQTISRRLDRRVDQYPDDHARVSESS